MKKIVLSDAKDKRYSGVFEYLINYNYNAGKSDRYNVMILNVEDPITIGRELPLPFVMELIAQYEYFAAQLPNWYGSRKDIKLVIAQVKGARLK